MDAGWPCSFGHAISRPKCSVTGRLGGPSTNQGSLGKFWLNNSHPKSGVEMFNVGWLAKRSWLVKD